MTRKLASKWCCTLLAGTALAALTPGLVSAEFCGAFPTPLSASSLTPEFFPANVFDIDPFDPLPPVQFVTISQALSFKRSTLFGDNRPLREVTFSVGHNLVSPVTAINPTVRLDYRVDDVDAGAFVPSPGQANWLTVTPASVTPVDPGFAREYTATLNAASISTFPAGIYRAEIILEQDFGSGVQRLGSVYVFLVVDDSIRAYPVGLPTFGSVTDPQVFLRIRTPDAADFGVFMQFTPRNGSPTTVSLYNGNTVGSRGYESTSDFALSNRDIAILFTDDGPSEGAAAYDRAVPSATGRWKPDSSITFPLSSQAAAVGAALDDEIEFGLSKFNGLTDGSYRLVLYSVSGTDQFEIIEACMLPSPTLEADLAPRGGTLGGPNILRILDVNDVFQSAFHLLGFDHLDTRLFPTFSNRSNVSAVRAEVLPVDLVTGNVTNNILTTLFRGFDAIASPPADNFRFSLVQGYGLEFGKLDVAPESSRGDGLVTVADFVQLALYAGGQTFPIPGRLGGPLSKGDRSIYLGADRKSRIVLQRGTTDEALPEIPVVLRSKGVEATLSIGIEYDAALLEFVSARRNGRAVDIPTFEIQNTISAGSGVVGIEVGLRPNRTFPLTEADGITARVPASSPISPLDGEADFTTGAGINDDVTIAFLKFRPRAGEGNVNTEIRLVQQFGNILPLGNRAPAVRSPSGTPLSTNYISSGVTILDEGAQRSTVRLDNKVLAPRPAGDDTIPATPQTVDVLLLANGFENGTGFTLSYNPADLEIVGIKPGADLPGSAFFLTNPDFFIPEGATPAQANTRRTDFRARTNEARQLKALVALQPGTTFREGRNVIATLEVLPRSLAPDQASLNVALQFQPLGDTLEIVDAEAIPVVSRFGTAADNNDSVTIGSASCSYTATATRTSFDLSGGNANLVIATAENCSWTVNTSYSPAGDSGWLRFTGIPADVTPSGSGNRTLAFTVAPYTGAVTRTATISVVNQTVVVTQTGCGVTVTMGNGSSTLQANFLGLGGQDSFRVATLAEGCTWTATTQQSWIRLRGLDGQLVSNLSGIGNRTVEFVIAPNTGLARVGQINVGGNIIQIQQDFTFTSGPEGWEFNSDPIPGFTLPTGVHETTDDGGRLSLITTNNTNTFGFWASPVLSLGETQGGADQLYRATFRVTTNAPQRQSPGFRLRASSGDFSQSSVFVVSSSDFIDTAASFAPSEEGRVYEHYFTLPAGQNSMRLFFDVLNFDPADQAVARVSLNSLAVAPFRISQLAGKTQEGPILIAGSTPFTTLSPRPGNVPAGDFAPATFFIDPRGRAVRNSMIDPTTAKLSIGIYDTVSNVALAANRVYEVKFQVSARNADATEVRRSKVPTFRTRVNESSMQLSSYVNIESIDDNSNVPTFLNRVNYGTWIAGTPELASRVLHLAFDYIYTPPAAGSETLAPNSSLNDPSIILILERIEINSYQRPN
jgi:hypothetical protein